ncbi:MAG: ATP-binding protein [Dehalococcoidia bacterium]
MGQVRELGPKVCPGCQEEQERRVAEEEKARLDLDRARLRGRWRNSCGIPPRFQAKVFENFERRLQPKAFDAARKFAEEFPLEGSTGSPSLVLYSLPPGYGQGKTHLACAVCHRIIDRWQGDPEDAVCPVLFVTETDLLLRIRATYHLRELEREWHEREEEVYAELKSKMLLILDDVGKEQPADPRFMQRVYFHVLDGRYQRGLPILMTSNLGIDDLEVHMGAAVVDRLVEMTGGKIVQLKGESYRRRKGDSGKS